MKLFLDSANLKEIEEIASYGFLAGLTTNPSLVAKENRIYEELLGEIVTLVDGPISAEVLALEANEMVEEGRQLAAIHDNIVIKIPFCKEGLKAIKMLQEMEIKTNCTLIFSANQALLAAQSGATYVSPFIGRLDDIGQTGMTLISEIKDIFIYGNIDTEIIAASIRNTEHVKLSALAGSDIATIPYKIYMQMMEHPLTDRGIQTFLNDFKGTRRING